MTRRLATLAACLILTGPLATASHAGAIPIVPGTVLGIVPGGGAAGGDALYCNMCDFIGPRNMQGGGPGGQSFDIGAGSTEDPGNIVFNWDVGAKSLFYTGQGVQADLKLSVAPDGVRMWWQGRQLAWFGPKGIVLYRQPKIRPRR